VPYVMKAGAHAVCYHLTVSEVAVYTGELEPIGSYHWNYKLCVATYVRWKLALTIGFTSRSESRSGVLLCSVKTGSSTTE